MGAAQYILLLLALICIAHGAGLSKIYDNCIVLDDNNGVTLSWTLYSDRVEIGMQGAFGGYLAMGMSVDGSMYGGSDAGYSDVWITDSTGALYDYEITSYSSVILDSQQDCYDQETSFEEGFVTAEFTRPLNTQDSSDYRIIPHLPVYVIWGGHSSRTLSGTKVPKHAVKGSEEVIWNERYSCSGSGLPFIDPNALQEAQPVPAPIQSPMAAPIQAPIQAPIPPPIQAPIQAPIPAPIQAPIQSPIQAPIQAPMSAPIQAPIQSPIQPLTQPPIQSPIPSPVQSPTKSPVQQPTQSPSKSPVQPPTQSVQYPWTEHFWSPNRDFHFTYFINGTNLHILMEGNTTGWISIGLSPYQHNMQMADIYTSWVNATTGKVVLRDEWVERTTRPKMDTELGGEKNAVLVSASESKGWTSIHFIRPLSSGDAFDWPINSENNTYFVLWAYSSKDGSPDGLSYSKHQKEDTFKVTFSGIPTESTAIPTKHTIPQGTASLKSHGPQWGSFVSSSGDFIFRYSTVGDYIHFNISAKTSGWLSIGISRTPSMTNADTYTSWFNSTGGLIFRDEWSPRKDQPILDSEMGEGDEISPRSPTMDAVVLYATKGHGWYNISFKRLLDTHDKWDYQFTNGDSNYYLIYAYSDAPGSDDGSSYPKHTVEGYQEIDFAIASSTVESEFYLLGEKYDVSPGLALLLIITIIMLILSTIHWLQKLLKIIAAQYDSTPALEIKTTIPRDRDNIATDAMEPGAVYVNNEAGDIKQGTFNSARPAVGVVHGRGYYLGAELVTRDSISTLNISDPEESASNGSALLKQIKIAPKEEDDGVDVDYNNRNNNNNNKGGLVEKIRILTEKERDDCACCCGVFKTRLNGQRISMGDILIAVFYVMLNFFAILLFANFYNLQTTNSWFHAVGSLVSANCVLTVITATRNSIFCYLIGIPFDRTIMYHRWLGIWVIVLCFIHAIIICADTYFSSYEKIEQTMAIIATRLISSTEPEANNIWGLIGLGISLCIGVASLETVRRKQFEIFLYCHYALALAFFVFSGLHSESFLPFLGLSIAFYLFDIVLRILWGGLPRKTSELSAKAGGMVRMKIPKSFPGLIRYKVGQYIFINVPKVSFHEWHPFSVASSPDSDEVEIYVKALGNWTTKLYKIAQNESSLTVRLDGPYGNLNLDYRRYPKILLVGGGIGITPILGILRQIYQTERKTPMKYVSAVISLATITELNWFMDSFKEIKARAEKNTKSPYLDLQVHVTRPTAEEETLPVFPGTSFTRPNLNQIFDKIGKHEVSKTPTPGSQNVPTFVFVCGPKKIVNICWDLSNNFAVQGKTFHFHHETFEF